MQRNTLVLISATFCLASFVGAVRADTTADLIALDTQWGNSGVTGDTVAAGKLLSDKLVAVDQHGVTDKKGQLADSKPAPAGTKYEPTDFKVTMLDADTAIMTHGTKGEDAHYSLHVWSHKSGKWQVVATSSTPAQAK